MRHATIIISLYLYLKGLCLRFALLSYLLYDKGYKLKSEICIAILWPEDRELRHYEKKFTKNI